MLAAAIRIDRLVEGNIGRIIPRDDRFGAFPRQLRSQWRQILGQIPAIVRVTAGLFFEASARIRQGAAAPLGESRGAVPGWRASRSRRDRNGVLQHPRDARARPSGTLAGAVSGPTRFCRAPVVVAAVSGFVGMATFSPLSCYCRVSGMFSPRDRVVSIIL